MDPDTVRSDRASWDLHAMRDIACRWIRRHRYWIAPAVVVVGASATSPWRDEAWWSGLGQWVGGVAAASAAAIALWISHRDWSLREAEKADRQKALALLVTITIARGKVKVTNHGPDAVLQLVITGIHGPSGFLNADPGNPPRRYQVLLPQGTWDTTIPLPAEHHEKIEALNARLGGPRYELELWFTDMSGKHWRRIGDAPPVYMQTTEWDRPWRGYVDDSDLDDDD